MAASRSSAGANKLASISASCVVRQSSFDATATVEEGGPPRTVHFTVNAPLRLRHASVHLLGHGYAPVLRYTDRYGQQQTNVFPFLPIDGMQTSEGVAMFPDANVDPKTGVHDPGAQVAFEGAYLPTVDPAGGPRSVFPEEKSLLYWARMGLVNLQSSAWFEETYSPGREARSSSRMFPWANTVPQLDRIWVSVHSSMLWIR